MKDFLFATLSRSIVIGAQLGYVKLYSSYLSNYELGLYFFLVTVSYSLNAFLFVPIDYYQQAKIYGYVKNNISLKTFVVFNKKCIAVTVAVTLALTLVSGLIRHEYALYTLLAGMLSITLYIGNALKGVLNNLEHRGFVSSILAMEGILKIVIFYAFLTFLPGHATTLISSATLALVLLLVPLAWRASKLPAFTSGKVTEIKVNEVFKFAYPVSIGAVINWIQLQGYRLVLVPLGFAEIVGIYATVSGIGNAGMGAAAVVFGQVFMPRIYKTSGEYTKTYLCNALVLVIGICIFSALFSDTIVTLLTKSEFKQFSWLILYGIIAEAGNFLIGALSVHLTIADKTKEMLVASIIGLVRVVSIFAAIYLLKFASVYTIGLPIICSQIVVLIYLYIVHLNTRTILNGSLRAQSGS